MRSPSRFALAAALAASLLLVAGCAQSPASSAPTSTSDPAAPSDASVGERTAADVEAAWIDEGRGFAVVTWGSSSCLPLVEAISAEGQAVSVTLADPAGADACTDDLIPRASSVGLPSGVDPTSEVEISVTYGDLVADTELDALGGAVDPDSQTDFQPSAGWFDDQGVVLLTWGSSTCPPQLEKIDQTATFATATFATVEAACTKDMVPQLTILGMPNEHEADEAMTLVLTGGGWDAEITVLGD